MTCLLITGILGEEELWEALYSIDTIQYTTIRELSDEIVRTIENCIATPKILHKLQHPGRIPFVNRLALSSRHPIQPQT